MNKLFLYEYIDKLKKEDIIKFALNKKINYNDNDIDIIYDYIKKYNILDNPKDILDDIKDKISQNVYNYLLDMYNKYKDKVT